MYCTRCGEKLENDAAFCEKCGTKVQDASSEATTKLITPESNKNPDVSGLDVSAYPTTAQAPFGANPFPQTTPMPTVQESNQALVAPPQQAAASKSKMPLMIAIIAIVVALVAIIVLVVSLVFGGNNETSESSSSGYAAKKEQQLSTSKESEQASSSSSSSQSQNGINSSNDYVLSDSNSRYYSESELNALTDYELYLARNEIYARNGRLFKNQDLQDYFNRKSWYSGRYSPDSFDSIVTLNSFEKKNAQTMLALEKARGSSYLQ